MSESQSLEVLHRPGFKRKKSAFWCEGCNKDFRSARNYRVHVERGKACPLTASSSTRRRRRTKKSSGYPDGGNEGDGDAVRSVSSSSSLDLHDGLNDDIFEFVPGTGSGLKRLTSASGARTRSPSRDHQTTPKKPAGKEPALSSEDEGLFGQTFADDLLGAANSSSRSDDPTTPASNERDKGRASTTTGKLHKNRTLNYLDNMYSGDEGLYGEPFSEEVFVEPGRGHHETPDSGGARLLPRRSPRKHSQGNARLAGATLSEPGGGSNRPSSHRFSLKDYANLKGDILLRCLRTRNELTVEQWKSIAIPIIREVFSREGDQGSTSLSKQEVEIFSPACSVGSAISPAARGIRQRMMALSSFAFNAPRKGRHTVGGDAAVPTPKNNPFVKAGVLFTKPDKFTWMEQGAAFTKSMDSPRSRGVVQPCHAAVRELLERTVDMLGPRANDESEEGLAELIKDLLTDPCCAQQVKEVVEDFATTFFVPTIEAHVKYWNQRREGITWRVIMGDNKLFEKNFLHKVIPKIVELSTDLLRKVDLLVVDLKTPPKDRFLLKARGVFRESEKEIVSPNCAIKGRERMWSRGCNKGSSDVSVQWRNGMWDTLGRYLSDMGGPYSRLSKMQADEVDIVIVDQTLIPYGVPS